MNWLTKAVYDALKIYKTPQHVIDYVEQISTRVED